MAGEQIRVGSIGANAHHGWSMRAHLPALRAMPDYELTVRYILFLCGYFDSGYLGYEAAERIDWVWEHRIDDLVEFGW